MSIKFFSLALCMFAGVVSAQQTNSQDLHSRWQEVKLDVATIGYANHHFGRSVSIFAKPDGQYQRDDYLYIPADVEEVLNTNDHQVVHILGSLNDDLYLSGKHPQVVIGGDVDANAKIYAEGSGMTRIFIGGSLYGEIIGLDATDVFVRQDFTGRIQGGGLTTNVQVNGNFSGSVSPVHDGRSSLHLKVDGFTSQASIGELFKQEFRVAHASFQSSDHAKGIFQPSLLSSLNYYVVKKQTAELAK